MKSFSVLKSNVGSFIQDTSSGTGTLIGHWVNNRYRDIVNSYDWEQLYHTQMLTATANTSAYPLDENTERVVFVHDKSNDSYTDIITEQEYLQGYYDVWDTIGRPEACFLKGEAVRSQPASGTQILVTSSSASDITQTVLVRGITSTQNEIYESLTLTGTTPATATNSYSQILGLSKSDVTVGKVKVYENDGTTLLAEMSPENLVSRYKILNFHPIPDSETIYAIRSKRVVLPLSQDYDYPIIEDIDDIIEAGAQADAWKYKRQFSKATALETQYQILKTERIHREVAQPGIIHTFTPTPLDRDDGIL